MFVLTFLVNFMYFTYAEDDTLEDTKQNEIINDYEQVLNGTEISDKTNEPLIFDNENNIEESNEYSGIQDILSLDSLYKAEDKQICEVEQKTQYIDTSSYGIIRISDPYNT